MKKVMLMGFLFGAIAAAGFSNEIEGVYTTKIGRFEVSVLVEAERDGTAEILAGADRAVLNRLIPRTGFKHTANAILVKDGKRITLIDTGTGAGGIIIDKIKMLGVQPEQVTAVLITHLHGDHFGSLQIDGKPAFPKAKVYLSKREHEHFTKTAPNETAIAALAPYGKNAVTFDSFELGANKTKDVVSGITPIAAYGHTPGHTVFLIQDVKAKASMLVIGDLLHVALVQFEMPQISAIYDMDQEAAAATRKQVLDYAAKNEIPIAGMHIVLPGTGNVSAEEDGFKFTPME